LAKIVKIVFELISSGATFAELTKGTFKKLKILTPPTEIVSKYSDYVNPLYKAIETLQGENRILRTTKKLLLPRLISGKLSVENLDIKYPPNMEEVNA
jgi:type I restriction enzyme, S subunit